MRRRLRPGGVDSQLVRLGFRLLTFVLVAWLAVVGADYLGIPITPLLAGIGVSGLAVALAAQYTLENLIAGLVLFADKPVRVGEICRFGDKRGPSSRSACARPGFAASIGPSSRFRTPSSRNSN